MVGSQDLDISGLQKVKYDATTVVISRVNQIHNIYASSPKVLDPRMTAT